MIGIGSKAVASLSIAILLLLIGASAVFPNSSSYFDKDASTVFPLESNNIIMKKEVVRIEPATAKVDLGVQWRADCEFTFYNKSDKQESVTMGYPDWLNERFDATVPGCPEFWKYFNGLPEKTRQVLAKDDFGLGYGYASVYIDGYRAGKIPYCELAWNLHDLNVLIDGNKVSTKHKVIVDAQDLPGTGAFVWKMRFPAHGTRTVKVSFTFSGFGDAAAFQRSIYILRTGRLWADKIGTADIYWNIKGYPANLKQILPRQFKLREGVVHWHLEDLEPSEDIVISAGENPDEVISALIEVFCSTRKYEGNARLYAAEDLNNVDLDKRMKHYGEELKINAKRLYRRALKNEIYARHGREFQSLELLDIFGNCDWYRPSKDYSDRMLNELELKNVELINNFGDK